MEKKKVITVRELIVILSSMPMDIPVFNEGCDCWGEVAGAKVVEGPDVDVVLITRVDGCDI